MFVCFYLQRGDPDDHVDLDPELVEARVSGKFFYSATFEKVNIMSNTRHHTLNLAGVPNLTSSYYILRGAFALVK